jgi:molybdate transport repressor ModE-like protein
MRKYMVKVNASRLVVIAMQIEHLRYLAELHNTGSISKAAENLFISQQGLSKAVQALEKQFGVPILSRSGNKFHFTAEGEMIVAKAEEIIAKVDELFAAVNQQTNSLNPTRDITMTIFCTPFFSLSFMPRILHQFRSKLPNINLLVLEKSPTKLTEDICNDHNAIGLINITEYDYEPHYFEEHNLVFTILNECEYSAMVARHSPLAKQPFVTIEEISKYNLALLDFEQMNSVYDYLFKMIGKPNIVLKTVNQDLFTSTIANGSVVGLTTSISRTFGKDNSLVTIPIKPSVKIYLGFVHCADSQNLNIQLFIKTVIKFINNSIQFPKLILRDNQPSLTRYFSSQDNYVQIIRNPQISAVISSAFACI